MFHVKQGREEMPKAILIYSVSGQWSKDRTRYDFFIYTRDSRGRIISRRFHSSIKGGLSFISRMASRKAMILAHLNKKCENFPQARVA